MSGGSLDYFYSEIDNHVGDLGDKELDDLVKDIGKLFYEREWYLSGDTNEGKWREARDAFKKKWFTEDGTKDRIDQYLQSIINEIRDSFGLSKQYCHNCKHWTKENDPDFPYGVCDITHGCLMHRSEKCEKFEENN